MPDARRAVSDGAFTMSPMFTLAATITRPARAAAAPSIATWNSCQLSRASMLGGYRRAGRRTTPEDHRATGRPRGSGRGRGVEYDGRAYAAAATR